MAGIPSNGMLLCVSNSDHSEVKLLTPPAGSEPGELITFEGHISEPAAPGNRAVKAWKKVGGQFETGGDGAGRFIGEPAAVMATARGACTSAIAGGPIS